MTATDPRARWARLRLASQAAAASLAGSVLALFLMTSPYEAVGVIELGEGVGVHSPATVALLASQHSVLRAAWDRPGRPDNVSFAEVEQGTRIDTVPGGFVRLRVRHTDTSRASAAATHLTRALVTIVPAHMAAGLTRRQAIIDDALVDAHARWLAAARAHAAIRSLVRDLERQSDLESGLAVRASLPTLDVEEAAIGGLAAGLESARAAMPQTSPVLRDLVVAGRAHAQTEQSVPGSTTAAAVEASRADGAWQASQERIRATAAITMGARAVATRFYEAEARQEATAADVRRARHAVDQLEAEARAIRDEQGRLRQSVRVVGQALAPSERLARQFLGHGVLSLALAGLLSLVMGSRASRTQLGRARLELIGGAFVVGVGASWLSEAQGMTVPWTAFVLGAVIALSLLGLVVVQGRLDPLAPPVVFCGIVVAGYLLPLPAFLENTDVISAIWPHDFSDFDASVGRALRLASLAVVGFLVGYGIVPPVHAFATRVPRVDVVPSRLALAGLGFVGAATVLAAALVVRIGGPSSLVVALADRTRAFAGMGYLVWGLMLPGIFCLFWWEHLLRQRRPLEPLFLLAAPCALAVSALTGSKANTFSLIVAGVVVYHVLYRPLRWRTVLAAGVCGVFGLALFELVVRDVLVRGWAYGDRGFFEVIWGATQVAVAGTFFQVQILSIVTDIFPERIAPHWGSSYLFLLAAPIPSSIWAAKPLPLAGTFTMALWPSQFIDHGTTIPTSLLGELFINFGWTGVLLGTASFGFVYRVLAMAVRLRSDVPALPSLYGIAMALMLHYVRGEASPVTVIALLLGLPVVTAAFLSSRPRAAR